MLKLNTLSALALSPLTWLVRYSGFLNKGDVQTLLYAHSIKEVRRDLGMLEVRLYKTNGVGRRRSHTIAIA